MDSVQKATDAYWWQKSFQVSDAMRSSIVQTDRGEQILIKLQK